MIYVFRAITKSLGKEKYLKAILRYPFIVYLQVSKSVVNLQLAIELYKQELFFKSEKLYFNYIFRRGDGIGKSKLYSMPS